jgi:hypothetical protein
MNISLKVLFFIKSGKGERSPLAITKITPIFTVALQRPCFSRIIFSFSVLGFADKSRLAQSAAGYR